MNRPLFPPGLPEREFVEFSAEGFSASVSGVIYSGKNPPDCGMPLGAVGTGCLDLEATGLLGFCTLFNSLMPRRGPLNLPFLGLSMGDQTWALTTLDIPARSGFVWVDWLHGHMYPDIRTAQEIRYWGHYPVADLEFVTDAPVEVGLRAWAPFLPGDTAASNTPAAVFEIHLRNRTDQPQQGTLAFSFPGPSEGEAGTTRFRRREIRRGLRGVAVSGKRASYVLGVLDDEQVRVGGELGLNNMAWVCLEHELPWAGHQAGASLAVDWTLEPGEERTIRFVLAWYAPEWQGEGAMTAGGNTYTHMHAARFRSATAVAQWVARHHVALLRRVLAWQQEIYSETSLPPWLRDSLVNILHLITETSVWAQCKPPLGDWCRPEDGLFAMNESPRWCPQMECIPCSFYGNLPLVYFFPELALSTLRAYKAYQAPCGAAPWVFGGFTVRTGTYELVKRGRGRQEALDGPCYVEMVDKLWQRTGDDALLREFYESVKLNTIFTMNMRPGSGPAGIVSMPRGGEFDDWYENCVVLGVVPHVGGVHLAQLRMAGRMATAVGDLDFAEQCREWLAAGSEVLEERGWIGQHYLLFDEEESGQRSEVILAYQLDGEWMARFHGLEGVFRPDRVDTTLETLKQTSLAMSPFGAVTFCKPQAELLGEGDWQPGYWGPHGVPPPGTFMLAMTFMYRGQREVGLDLAGRTVNEIVRRGYYWDWPVILDGAEGPRCGFDYYQNMMLWSLAAAAAGEDLTGPCQPGGLVSRILEAGQVKQL